MNKLSLQTRFVLWIAAGVLAVLVSAEVLRQHHQRTALQALSQTNRQRLEEATRRHMESLQFSVLASLRDAMEQGEMDRMAKILNRQGSIEGLLECSLVGTGGKVSYSSLASALHRPLEPDLKAGLLTDTNRLARQTAEAFEIYQPLVAEKGCVTCHTDWKQGQVGGVVVLRLSNAGVRKAVAESEASVARMRRENLIGGAGLCVGLVIALMAVVTVLVRWLLTKPLSRIRQGLDYISHGDLSHEVDRALGSRQDEIGHLARALETMTHNLRQLLQNVSEGVQTLVSSATGLSAISSQTSGSVKSVSETVATVAATANEASQHTLSVAAGMEQASTNLTSVATATEEMSSTVVEIASNSERARTIGEQAMQQSRSMSALMQELGNAAQAIGKVTETITDISSQTNLLALNATIEAARAGAAGKGFAVVANEIKELAQQTAAATEDIKSKIAGVQNSAGNAIADIEKITAVIQDVGHIVSSIATAIEEQAAVTKDVAGNIAQASAGVKDANHRVAQSAAASASVAKDIAGIDRVVGELRKGGDQVQISALDLSRLAEQLEVLVGQFQFAGSLSSFERDPRPLDPSPRTGNGEPFALVPSQPSRNPEPRPLKVVSRL